MAKLKNKKKDDVTNATEKIASSSVCEASGMDAAPSIASLAAPATLEPSKNAVEVPLVSLAATSEVSQNVTINGKDKVAANLLSASSTFPKMETRARTGNQLILDAMKLKSGKLVTSSTSSSCKLKQNLGHVAPSSTTTSLSVAASTATLSELLNVEKQSERTYIDAMETICMPVSLVESVGAPIVLVPSSNADCPGAGDGPSVAELEHGIIGVSSTLGQLCGSDQGTPKVLEVDLGHSTNLESESAPLVDVPTFVGCESGVGVDSISALPRSSSSGVTNTLGQDCAFVQGTQGGVDPVANVEQLIAPTSEKSDFIGPNGGAAVDGVASWIDMVKKNRSTTQGVVSLIDCTEGVTEDCVFIEDDDVDSDSIEKFSLIGIFPSKFPGRDAVQKIVNSWPKRCRFNFHNSGWIVFVFEKEEDVLEVLQAGPYYAFGKQLLLKRMPHLFDFSKENCTIVPVWIQFPNLPLGLWNTKSLSKICSFVGSPQHTDVVTAKKQVLSFARCLVEVDLKMELPNIVPLRLPSGKILMQPVLYEEMPKFCTKCSKLGHTVEGHDDTKVFAPSLYVPKSRKNAPKQNSKKKKVNVEDPSGNHVSEATAAATIIVDGIAMVHPAISKGKAVMVEEGSVADVSGIPTGVTALKGGVTAHAVGVNANVVNTFSVLSPISGKNWADEAELEDGEAGFVASASGSKKSKKKKKGNKHRTDYVLDVVEKPDPLISRGKAPLKDKK